MAGAEAVYAKFEKFRSSLESASSSKDFESCARSLEEIKLLLTRSVMLPPLTAELNVKDLLLSREVYEAGAFLSIRTKDILAFERYVAQLKVLYNDFGCGGRPRASRPFLCDPPIAPNARRRSMLPESQHQYPILGLNLLRLLAQNRTAEFHTELELIPADLHTSNVYIKHPMQLEQFIMEGSFSKVLKARVDGLYSKDGEYFMSMLTDTVREEIANCAEKAYASLSLESACKVLMLNSASELESYAQEVQVMPHTRAGDAAALTHARCPSHSRRGAGWCPGVISSSSSRQTPCSRCRRSASSTRRSPTPKSWSASCEQSCTPRGECTSRGSTLGAWPPRGQLRSGPECRAPRHRRGLAGHESGSAPGSVSSMSARVQGA